MKKKLKKRPVGFVFISNGVEYKFQYFCSVFVIIEFVSPPLISSVATAVKEPTPIPYSVNVLIIDFVGNEGESSWLYRRLLSLPALTHYCMPLCW
jgi:hypothetical protein